MRDDRDAPLRVRGGGDRGRGLAPADRLGDAGHREVEADRRELLAGINSAPPGWPAIGASHCASRQECIEL